MTGAKLLTLLAAGLSAGGLILDGTAGRNLFANGLNNFTAISFGFNYGCTWLLGSTSFTIPSKMGQIIREDGPQTHLRKAGTPTMGGIFFIPVAVVCRFILVWFRDARGKILALYWLFPLLLLVMGQLA